MAAYVDPMYFLPCKKSERLPKKGEVHLFVLMPELSLTVAYFVRIYSLQFVIISISSCLNFLSN